ncbi:bifunctional 23S rRNA (guanine(2069)-N(7))-methyltransferase RlmK/23S rRNA (guanine(2445)-N(2))-methyltransferase RlmL [Phytohalomonas tamaricis]|uniref:bifunctional 23S rRNA (guanine(2069)-N(7))-methyltransferase RlmK/23S rRNA (guanine(2445)-N(2))-methyltransferase RlmL n=1 Tax=Phytohalomonas tamaricis TaxID=2081032 RepID=UPI000D0BB0F0|nr:bifunctional 23S rRNA (guanine(2069)-N(7))-methyltransferase RlmK/23S rRNA (guanine(2445)-N(2))-methyltransferase RlmL [Phytohalomonas tamaricis]
MTVSDASSQLSVFVTCPKGLEQLLAEELTVLGAAVEGTTVAGVYAQGALDTLYRCCLWSRLANRVILRLASVEQIVSTDDVRHATAQVAWENEIAPGASFKVDFHGQSDSVRHTRFGAQLIKDGVVERMIAQGKGRPNVDPKNADLRLYAHLYREKLTLGLDLSGDSLHMRGYRLDGAKAPLKENLAAALLVRADWPGRAKEGNALIDPLCGSGTLVIEAALMAADIAPNVARSRFGFHAWARHDDVLWQELHREAEARASLGKRRCQLVLIGQDLDPGALEAARYNARRAGVESLVRFTQADVATLEKPPGAEQGLVITNPPYGERLGDMPTLVPLYAALGERLRQAFAGWRLALFTANPELGHRTGLKAEKQYAFKNGALDCKLFLIDIFSRAGRGEEDKRVEGKGEGEARQPAPSRARSQGAQMFANRLEKNRKKLAKWLKREQIQCYRLYDADMPEYALAVDVYDSCVHVQEYVAPRSVDAKSAERRLLDALAVIPEVLNIEPGNVYLKRRERQSGKAQYTRQSTSNERFEVREGNVRLWVNLRDYLDTGLFLDHRPVRQKLGQMASGTRFLNLFCYTATATLHAAIGGAKESISVDMSNTYLDWGRDNFRLNGLDERQHRLVRADCMRWLEEADGYFDLIFLDPPTFSNSKKMEDTLDIQRDHIRLVQLAMARLAPGGTLVFSNNQRRFVLDESLRERFMVEDISKRMLDPDFQRRPDIHHVFLIRHS